jgi:hypothetical protein
LQRTAAKFADADDDGDEHIGRETSALRGGATGAGAGLVPNANLSAANRRRKAQATQQEKPSAEKPVGSRDLTRLEVQFRHPCPSVAWAV